jgi:hypothetical protein
MTGCEDDPGFAALDAHIRTQLAGAAETYASHVDLDARLQSILKAETDTEQDELDTTRDQWLTESLYRAKGHPGARLLIQSTGVTFPGLAVAIRPYFAALAAAVAITRDEGRGTMSVYVLWIASQPLPEARQGRSTQGERARQDLPSVEIALKVALNVL